MHAPRAHTKFGHLGINLRTNSNSEHEEDEESTSEARSAASITDSDAQEAATEDRGASTPCAAVLWLAPGEEDHPDRLAVLARLRLKDARGWCIFITCCCRGQGSATRQFHQLKERRRVARMAATAGNRQGAQGAQTIAGAAVGTASIDDKGQLSMFAS